MQYETSNQITFNFSSLFSRLSIQKKIIYEKHCYEWHVTVDHYDAISISLICLVETQYYLNEHVLVSSVLLHYLFMVQWQELEKRRR